MSLIHERNAYKPFQYPWAYKLYKEQSRAHWLPEEVTLEDDIKDYNEKLNDEERHLLTQIFRFFTQADVDVACGYAKHFLPTFKAPEVVQMLATFASFEAIHIDAYSLLIETLGLPETEYAMFLEYKAMADKHEYLNNFNMTNPHEIAKTLAIYSAFTEGVQLFSSFAILLNFPRSNLMKKMGQIVTWSIRDESLHVDGMSRLFRAHIEENPGIMTDKLKSEIYIAAERTVSLEDNFIDTCYGDKETIRDLNKNDVKGYIRYIANRRLHGLGLKGIFAGYDVNPLDWLSDILNTVEHANFFETRSTEYSKASTTGSWLDVFPEA